MHQSTWTYKWLVKWDYKIYIFLSWLILTSQNWKEIVEKTFVRYLERKIARTLKLLLIPWKLFFSQTNRNATAGKWKLASTEPTQRYMFYFGRQEHPVFSVLMLWLVKQKEKQLKRYFPKKEYIILTCWERSEFKPWRLRKEKQLRLRSGSHC